MTIELHRGDLPAGLELGPRGRGRHRDHGPQPGARPAVPGAAVSRRRHCHLVQLAPRADCHRAPTSRRLLDDRSVLKLFHFARFDIAVLRPISASTARRSIAPRSRPGWCAPTPTGTGSRICAANCWASSSPSSSRPRTGVPTTLTPDQLNYAASDVLYLHELKAQLDPMLAREGRTRAGRGLLRLPADPGRAGSGGLGPSRTFSRTDRARSTARDAPLLRKGLADRRFGGRRDFAGFAGRAAL